ncbi:MAG: PQQ-like beta-propeller repeat protein [Planctomycetia bacterium]|nr:PQQ-like beta-propeller repeat protein [Planctomycetia bacterium]
MMQRLVSLGALAGLLAFAGFSSAPASRANDWPQWRGLNRDAKVTGFKAPKTWPKELKEKWKVTVGDGVATPALVGDKLYVFTREGNSEITRCLNAGTGKEIWQEKYDTAFKGGGDRGYPGPRSSPAVADGMVVTLGVNGHLSCLDAATGKKAWRIETKGFPKFHTSSSPVIVDKLVVAQFGGEGSGGVTAYELATGKEKWKWTDEGTAYASPVVMTVDGTKMIVAETDKSVVGIGLANGKTLWKVAFVGPGRLDYNASTPIIEGQTIIFSGVARGTYAIKIEKTSAGFAAKELWKTTREYAAKFNTPVVTKGLVIGLTDRNTLFCLKADSGKVAWTESIKGKGGYGSIVDVGPVLMTLTTAAQLAVIEPTDKEYKELASYKVSSTETYAYPILSGNRIYIKDKDSVILYTIE